MQGVSRYGDPFYGIMERSKPNFHLGTPVAKVRVPQDNTHSLSHGP